MRRQPGESLRRELRENEERNQKAIWLARHDGSYYIGVGAGFVVAALVTMAMLYLFGPLHVWLLALVLLAAAAVFVAWGYIVGKKGLRPRAAEGGDRWRTEDIEKGEKAEKRIGQAIDYAVAAPGCAVAHDVTNIAKYGNIDHIVLTPARLWVVETKSARVPPSEFPKTLGQIAANVEAAREWVRREWARDRDVQGCLVLASGEASARDKEGYDAREDKILVEDRKSLAKKLRDEARVPHAADDEDVKRVWALGKMEE